MGDTYRLLLGEDKYAMFDTDDMQRFVIQITEDVEKYAPYGDNPLEFLLQRQIAEQEKEGFDFLKAVQTGSRKDIDYWKEDQADTYLTFFVRRGKYEIKNISDLPKDKFGQTIWS